MRTNSKIRNRNMTKRETEKTVKEIWAEKRSADRKENTVTELSAFMPLFFQKKMGLPAAVTEMTYNFMFSLKKVSPPGARGPARIPPSRRTPPG